MRWKVFVAHMKHSCHPACEFTFDQVISQYTSSIYPAGVPCLSKNMALRFFQGRTKCFNCFGNQSQMVKETICTDSQCLSLRGWYCPVRKKSISHTSRIISPGITLNQFYKPDTQEIFLQTCFPLDHLTEHREMKGNAWGGGYDKRDNHYLCTWLTICSPKETLKKWKILEYNLCKRQVDINFFSHKGKITPQTC